jgi:membrane protease YdiL (CAAX protease family)
MRPPLPACAPRLASAARATKGRPVLAFVLLTCAWSFFWWSLILAQVAPGALFKAPAQPAALAFMVIGAIGPSLAGIVMTAWVDGRSGLRGLWARLRLRRIGRWWAVALAPWLINVLPFAAWLAAGGRSRDIALRLGPAVGLGAMASLCEELGWRGFLLPRLERRHRPLVAALIVGAIWGGVWHGYADYIGLGDLGWRAIPLIVLLGPALLSAHSVILARLHDGSGGSLLACVVYHFGISTSAFLFAIEYRSYGENVVWSAITCALAWVLAALVVRATSRWTGDRAAAADATKVGRG